MVQLTDYLPSLTTEQQARFAAMEDLYRTWNAQINVISRKDMDQLRLHHILHSLAIARLIDFPAGSTVLDVGTGGGFPGIPLAVRFPAVRFTLCDSVGKKIKVARAVAEGLGLENVICVNDRVENLPGNYDFVVSRAVTDLATFYHWIRGRFRHAAFYLKGGDLEKEIAECVHRERLDPGKIFQVPIADWFPDPWYAEKKIVVISQ